MFMFVDVCHYFTVFAHSILIFSCENYDFHLKQRCTTARENRKSCSLEFCWSTYISLWLLGPLYIISNSQQILIPVTFSQVDVTVIIFQHVKVNIVGHHDHQYKSSQVLNRNFTCLWSWQTSVYWFRSELLIKYTQIMSLLISQTHT